MLHSLGVPCRLSRRASDFDSIASAPQRAWRKRAHEGAEIAVCAHQSPNPVRARQLLRCVATCCTVVFNGGRATLATRLYPPFLIPRFVLRSVLDNNELTSASFPSELSALQQLQTLCALSRIAGVCLHSFRPFRTAVRNAKRLWAPTTEVLTSRGRAVAVVDFP